MGIMNEKKTPAYFRQQQAARAKWEAEREAEILGMETNKADLEKQLDEAINADDPARTEKLMKEIADLTGKLEARKLILETRKKVPAVSLDDLAAAQHESATEYNEKLLKAIEGLKKARVAFYNEYMKTVKLRAEALDNLWDYCHIADIWAAGDQRVSRFMLPVNLPSWDVHIFNDPALTPYSVWSLNIVQSGMNELPEKP